MSTDWRTLSPIAASARLEHAFEEGCGVVLDTETTGLKGFIVEVAVIDTKGEVLVNTLINPECPIPAQATAIHGIRTAHVKSAPTLSDVWDEICAATQGRVIMAHNAPFDFETLQRHAERDGLNFAGHSLSDKESWLCTMRVQSLFHRKPWQKLHGGHRALGDTQLALALAERLAGKTESFSARLSADAFERLQAMAKDKGLTLSELLGNVIDLEIDDIVTKKPRNLVTKSIRFVPETRALMKIIIEEEHATDRPNSLSAFARQALDGHDSKEILVIADEIPTQACRTTMTPGQYNRLTKLAEKHETSLSRMLNTLCLNELNKINQTAEGK